MKYRVSIPVDSRVPYDVAKFVLKRVADRLGRGYPRLGGVLDGVEALLDRAQKVLGEALEGGALDASRAVQALALVQQAALLLLYARHISLAYTVIVCYALHRAGRLVEEPGRAAADEIAALIELLRATLDISRREELAEKPLPDIDHEGEVAHETQQRLEAAARAANRRAAAPHEHQ